MNRYAWFLVGYLILSGLIVVVRAAFQLTREYGPWDAILTPFEVAFIIWVVTKC